MMVMAMTQNNWCKIKEDQPAAHFLWGKTNNLKYFGIVSKNGENDDRQAVQQYISLPRLIIKAEKRKMHLFSPLNVSCWVNNYSLCCSVTKLCTTLCKPMDHSMPAFLVLHYLTEFAQVQSIASAMPSNHVILCHLLLLLPLIFPSIRVFSNELALCIRWPKYCSFSITPSNEYSGLISFRID